jgi:hypothetical protein
MAIYACPAGVDMTQELLKLALEALETELSIDWTNNDEFNASAEKMHEAITAIKEALEQPEQKPVAWMFQHDETGRMNYVSNDGIHNPTMFLEMNPRYALVCPLYTTPSQRTWVSLTNEEIDSYFENHGWSPSKDYYPVIKAIEAKLKQLNDYAEEKNN